MMTELRLLAPKDDKLIGHIIGHSFSDDALHQWLFNGETGIEPFYKSMARKVYLKRGFGHVMKDGSAGTMWLPPSEPKDIPPWRNLDIVASMLRHGGLTAVKNGVKANACLHEHRPKDPHYYLFTIGALPEARGKGIGGRIMQAGLDVIDEAQMPTYLENTKYANISFYQRYGFEVVEKVAATSSAPPFWLMWRPTQGADKQEKIA